MSFDSVKQFFSRPIGMVVGVAILLVVAYLIYVVMNQTPAPVVMPTEVVNPEEAVMNEAMKVAEGFQDTHSPIMDTHAGSAMPQERFQDTSAETTTTAPALNQLPSECYPKDVLNSVDLLPKDANSLWAQVSPNGQGALSDQNFLTAGYHIGINTVGQTLRNANRQLRSEPPNPQVKVSPWNQTTIDPDINRRPLEIGGAV